MKYCNRCFRNITEDVAVCPHCGKSDKLIDYDRQKKGEDFTCNKTSSAGLSGHIEKKDAYTIEQEDAYGNKTEHNLDNCENSDNNYIKSLTPEQRRQLLEEKRAKLNQELGKTPTKTSNVESYRINNQVYKIDKTTRTVTVNGKKMSEKEFVEYVRQQNVQNSAKNAPPLGLLKALSVAGLFLGPFVSAIVLIAGSIYYPEEKAFFAKMIVISFVLVFLVSFILPLIAAFS